MEQLWTVRDDDQGRYEVVERNPDHHKPGALCGLAGEWLVVAITDSEDTAKMIAAMPNLLLAAGLFLDRIRGITTEDFSRGGDKVEREELATAIAATK
ncbi:hypothetical protein LCGC14_1671920 [marine sediment metagenome]|uniref:Uncharacterized protein n=1 Tax=marine sediment metagenome TaxID=412755 RepID=A0A0F9HRS6_9ZZZZ